MNSFSTRSWLEQWFVPALLIISVPLLFTEFSFGNTPAPRFLQEFYNLGHIPLFMLTGYWLWPRLHGTPHNHSKLLIWLAICVAIAILIELLQNLTSHRSASWLDLRRDCLGLALLLITRPRPLVFRLCVQKPFQIIVVTWLLLELIPASILLLDYTQIIRQPNLLSDFESPGQASRWNSGQVINAGNASVLKVALTSEQYSGASLEHLPRNWSQANKLHLEVFNADQTQQTLHFKIDDQQAIEQGNSYSMRFNTTHSLQPGWNNINIPIQRIHDGPEQRKMDLTQIFSVTLFHAHRPAPGYMLLDNLRLEK